MKNVKLFTSVAVAALIAGAPSAFAQSVGDVTQNVSNIGNVTTGTSSVTVTSVTGDAASGSVSATGAASSVSGRFVGETADFVEGSTLQNTTQSGNVVTNNALIDGLTGNITGQGASLSISASGAVSSVGATFIDSEGRAEFGDVNQFTQTTGNVRPVADGPQASRPQIELNGANVTGDGASVAISATGAASAVSLTGIEQNQSSVTGASDSQSVGDITQRTFQQNGDVQGAFNARNIIRDIGNVSGVGASVSASATGAASSVSVTQIKQTQAGNETTAFGNIDQTTRNNSGGTVGPQNANLSSGENGSAITGDGASISVSATGAVSSVSSRFIQSPETATLRFGDKEGGTIDQVTSNSADLAKSNVNQNQGENANPLNLNDQTNGGLNITAISGDGASFSFSGTGAASAVSVTTIESTDVGGSAPRTFIGSGSIDQTTTNTGEVRIGGGYSSPSPFGARTLGLGAISGDGASAAISGTGAASSVSITSIKDDSAGASSGPQYTVGAVSQFTQNTTDDSTETGDVRVIFGGGPGNPDQVTNLNAGNLSGLGASVSISGTAAVSAVSARFIASDETDVLDLTSVDQNTSNVVGANEAAGEVFVSSNRIDVGNLSGAGSSVSVSGTGAASSVAYSTIANVDSTSLGPDINVGPVDQLTLNEGSVTVNGGTINAGNLSGNGTSVSIAATGAVSAVSVSSINAGQTLGGGAAGNNATTVGNVTQTTTNTAPVTASGAINAASLAGNGAGVSVSATGAAASVGASAIK